MKGVFMLCKNFSFFKKFLLTLGIVLMVSTLAGCPDPNSPNPGPGSDPEAAEKAEKLRLKKSLLNRIKGSWTYYYDNGSDFKPANIVITDSTISFDGVSYTFTYDDLLLASEFNPSYPDNTIGFNLSDYPMLYTEYVYHNDEEFYSLDFWPNFGSDCSSYKRCAGDNGGGDIGSGDPSAFAGTYSYTTGDVSTNGSLTLNNDGTWIYHGNKQGYEGKTGTYSVSGSTITISATNVSGIDVSDSFTVTTNGDSVTWTQASNSNSLFLQTYFSCIFSITFTKS